MTHPLILNLVSKQTCMNLPNLEELSLRMVLALPAKKIDSPRNYAYWNSWHSSLNTKGDNRMDYLESTQKISKENLHAK